MRRKDHQHHRKAAVRSTAAGSTESAGARADARRTRRIAFRQADVSRALKGATAAGLVIGRVEIDQTGKIVIVATTDAAPGLAGNPAGGNEWDEVLK